jgi:hypothetical protein
MKGTEMTQLTATELFALIAKTQFAPFTEADWDVFAGCQSETPFIGYNGDFTIVIDDETVNVIHAEDEFGGQLFCLRETEY